MSETIFHRIIRREIPATIEFESETLIVIRDINPQAPFHCLIIPKKTIRSIQEITQDDAGLLLEMVQAAKAMAIDHGFDQDGYRLVMNCEEWGGQTVFQLHMHMLAGAKLSGGFA
ncbi:MAG: histidine triad nucleotide-binding protein [Ignavibacteriae bacterium]|jgi:histidine triad (HIT) family protein|nr:histidine triad nucleotide-binding protein [Ignavibacteriota bacterium]